MDMGTGTAPGIAHQRYGVPAFDFVTPFFKYFRAVAIAGDHAVSVIDYDGVTEQSFFADKGNHAICCGQDGSSMSGGNIISLVKFASLGERGCTISEPGSYP